MNHVTRLALLACTAGSTVALTALGTLLAVGFDSTWVPLLATIVCLGGLATVVTIALTVALATLADRKAPWRVGAPEPYRYRLHVVRDAIEAPAYELESGL